MSERDSLHNIFLRDNQTEMAYTCISLRINTLTTIFLHEKAHTLILLFRAENHISDRELHTITIFLHRKPHLSF